MALDPELPGRPVRLRPLHVRPRLGDAAARRRGARRAPPPTVARPRPGATDGRLRRQRPPLAAAGERQRHDRLRAGADRGLVPAVPEPLGRHRRVRPRRRALRERRRRRELQLRRLRPGRQPAQPVRRPARRRGRDADAADGRGRRAAEPGPAHVRRSGRARRLDHPRRPRHRRRRCRRNPLAGSTDANARRIIAYGLRNPFRFTFRPGTSELWIGDVGWNDWEEINRIDRPDGLDRRELRLAVLRGEPAAAGLRRARPAHLREPLRRRRRVTSAVLRVPAHRQGRRRRDLPDRQLVDLRDWRSSSHRPAARTRPRTTARSSSPTTRATASG